MLSQKAQPQDISAVEYLLAHLLENGSITREQLRKLPPFGLQPPGPQHDRYSDCRKKPGRAADDESELLRDRSVHKYYCCIVKGKMEGTQYLKGYLVKDHATNQVRVSKELTKNEEAAADRDKVPGDHIRRKPDLA